MLSHATARRASAPTFADLRERVDLLEEENRQLRALLTPTAHLPPEWGLTPYMTRAVTILARARGQIVPVERMMVGVFGFEHEHLPSHLYVVLSKVRQREAQHGLTIRRSKGLGYSMPAEACERVLAALR